MPDPPRPGEKALTGAVATHAWIEVLVPGMAWVAIDPTNRQWCNERYVAVSYGRDFRDAGFRLRDGNVFFFREGIGYPQNFVGRGFPLYGASPILTSGLRLHFGLEGIWRGRPGECPKESAVIN